MKKIWKIKENFNKYEISNYGEVRLIKPWSNNHKYLNIKPKIDKYGNNRIILIDDKGNPKICYIHILLNELFNQTKPKKEKLIPIYTILENEIWKGIPGCEYGYEVSSKGRVKSLNFGGTGKVGLLSQRLDRYGYFKVSIKDKLKSVHQLVAMAFLGLVPDGTQKFVVNHKDSDRTNNNVENLEVVTMRQNSVHGTKKRISVSKYTGVSKSGKHYHKWTSNIRYSNKTYKLGYFDIEKDAGEIYEEATEAINNNMFENFYVELSKNSKADNTFTSEDFTSAYRGVNLHPKTKKWIGSICRNNTTYRLGQFETELDAHLEFKNAEKAYEDGIFEEYLKGLNININIKTSKYKGVYFETATSKWSVHINYKNKSTYLSYYDTEEEAHLVYENAEKNIQENTFEEYLIKIKNRYKIECEFKNIYYNTKVNKWVVFDLINGKEVKIGYYKTKESAVKVKLKTFENRINEVMEDLNKIA